MVFCMVQEQLSYKNQAAVSFTPHFLVLTFDF